MRRALGLATAILVIPAAAFAVDRALVEQAKSANTFERARAAGPLAKDGSPAAAKLLLDLARDTDPFVRDAAVLAGDSLENPAGVKLVAGSARSRDELLRLNLAELLGRTRSADAFETLRGLVGKDRSARVRGRALDWLWGWSKVPGALDLAVEAYGDDDPAVRAAAVEAAGRMRGEAALELTRKALADEDEGVRCVARMELRYLAPDEALAGLEEGRKAEGWRTRAQTVEDALHLRKVAAVDALVELVGDEVLRVSVAAHRALVALSGKEIGRDVELWRAWWKVNRANWKAPKGKLGEAKGGGKKSVARFQGVEIVSGRVCFVLDRSGSMADPMKGDADGRTCWQYVTAELAKTLDALPDGTKVNVVTFNNVPTVAARAPRTLGKKSRAALSRFATKQSAGGRGDLLAAMMLALSMPEIDTVILLSDGTPSHGEIVNRVRARSFIRAKNRMAKRAIMTIGFGAVVPPERKFMEGVARDSGGVCVFR